MQNNLNKIIRVSVSEAARLFGVNSKTVRRAIKKGDLKYVVVRGRYKINFESLVLWSQQAPYIKNKNIKNGIGQYVDKWKINNRHFSPSQKLFNDK